MHIPQRCPCGAQLVLGVFCFVLRVCRLCSPEAVTTSGNMPVLCIVMDIKMCSGFFLASQDLFNEKALRVVCVACR